MQKVKSVLSLKCTDGCGNRLEIEYISDAKYLAQIWGSYNPNIIERLRACFDFLFGKDRLPKSDNIVLTKKQLIKINDFINKKKG